MTEPVFPVGVATGVGSWPGTDPREAAAVIVGELPGLPHLVELPARGVGADTVGRASALLVDMPFDTTPRGYRLAARPGGVARRASDLLRTDLDALQEAWENAGLRGSGRPVKVQATGPLTLAAQLELPGGHRVLTDRGAVRDLADSLAEGLAAHITEVAARLETEVVLQLDEPSVAEVLNGSLSGVSVLNTVPAVPEPEARAVLDAVLGPQRVPTLVHTCANRPPLDFLRGCAADALGFDITSLSGAADLDAVGQALDAGTRLVLGVVPTAAPETPVTWREFADSGARLMDRLGFPRALLARQVAVSPACGLAGASWNWARNALRLASDTAKAFEQDPESPVANRSA